MTPVGRRLRECFGRLILFAAWALLYSAPARAGEDAGTLSPFASGAGARAIGMGGAYTVGTENAAALMWNPANLALAQRFGLETGFAQFEESGAGEQFVGVVLPSWRWGALGLTMRHVGVGGIEQRDAQNLVTGSLFSADETELTLGYARPMGSAVRLGAGFKLQGSTVGQASDAGFGADLGFAVDLAPLVGARAAWLSPLSLAVAVRNAIEPSQRLELDPVSDPRVMRFGMAWVRGIGFSTVRFGADLDHSQGVTTHARLGGELEMRELLALRAGFNQGHLAAGTSLRWQGLQLDYAYEQRDLGVAHHFGISKMLGSTLTERREAVRAAQERRLADTLTAVYQRRLTEQVDELLARARDAWATKRTEAALDALSAARALAPTDTRAMALEAEILRSEGDRLLREGDAAGAALSYGRALEAFPGDSLASTGRRRAQAELARRSNRSRNAKELDGAYALFASGDLVGARVAFLRLRDAMPTDTVATVMLARIEQAIAQKLATTLEKFHRNLAAGLFDDAQRDLDAARVLGAPAADLAALNAQLQSGRQRDRDRSASPTAAAPTRPPVTDEQRRQADADYRQGSRLAAAGQMDPALRYWELALSLDPEHRGARQALEREYLLRGMVAFGHGRLEEAESNWSRVVDLDPSDARARGYLEQARISIARTRELTGNKR